MASLSERSAASRSRAAFNTVETVIAVAALGLLVLLVIKVV